jgi:Tol biopolymer transport system component
LWALAAARQEPLTAQPPGWYLVTQGGQSDQEQLLVALSSVGRPKQVVASEIGTSFLTAAISPDGRYIAVLKRVARSSMPTDAVSLYDRRSFALLSTAEAQISFQRTPTFAISWSPDSSQLAVSYNSGRTLVFRVRDDSSIGLQAMLRYGGFQFHPTQTGSALSEVTRPGQDTIRIVELAPGAAEKLIENVDGTDALWSPNGASLAYQRPAGQSPRLFVRDEATRQILHTLSVDVFAQAWSPDSRHLAVFGKTNPDPLNLKDLFPVPIDTIPGLNGGKPQLRLSVYDRDGGRTHIIENLSVSFLPVRLAWLNSDWLLLAGIPVDDSFISDRYGQRKAPIPALSSYMLMLGWIPE